ncbi:MAG: 2OG-Fe(II) oxygenase [Phycisphaerales bacterium]|nr:2OG-Fe(II) oxygenase [Hyphomonadaceae bacterium]
MAPPGEAQVSPPDLSSLQQRAGAGDARAQFELGSLLLVGRGAPWAPQQAYKLLDAAAAQNEPNALLLSAVLSALGEGRAQDWTKAHQLVERAAAAGDARAKAQLALLGAGFDAQAWLTPPPPTQHFEAPRVLTFERFISPEICQWIAGLAAPRLEAARVKNPEHGGANADGYRSNTGMGLSVLDTDLVVQLVHARIAGAIGVPVNQQEPTNILHYAPGQEYKPHFDFIDPGVAHFAQEVQRLGQRIVTFLIYLNDDYEGGATGFPRLDWSFKGQQGDALAFWNTTDGRPDPRTLHAGTPTTIGVKWLFSKWVRDRPLPLV